MFSFLLGLCFQRIFRGGCQSIQLFWYLGAFLPARPRHLIPLCSLTNATNVTTGHIMCAHLVSGSTDHLDPRWSHGRSAGPGPAQGTSGAPRVQALHKRLVVLPTAAWGKGYRVQLRPLLRVCRMYQCFKMPLNERCFMNIGY